MNGSDAITLHQLRVFASVAHALSYTAAARELHLSQSVVSRMVQQLEKQLGAQLLRRTSRSVALTPAGHEFVAIAETTLGIHERGLDRFAGFLTGSIGSVRVAAVPSVASSMLPRMVTRFRSTHPGVTVHLSDALSATVHQQVLNATIDIGIAAVTSSAAGLREIPWFQDRLHAVLPPDDPLTRRTSVTWKDLATRPFVALEPSSSVRMNTDAGFALANVAPDIVQVASTLTVAGSLVAAGMGVTAMPELALPLTTYAGAVARELVAPTLERQLGLLTLDRARLSPATEALLSFLLENNAMKA